MYCIKSLKYYFITNTFFLQICKKKGSKFSCQLTFNPENKNVLKTLISGINLDYDSLMAECIFLSEEDLLPGTQTERISVEQAKLEFDARVKSWYESVDSSPIGTKSLCPLSAPGSKESSLDGGPRCSGRSSRSSLSSFKRKESLVKLKLASFANEKEKERSRIRKRPNELSKRPNELSKRPKEKPSKKPNELSKRPKEKPSKRPNEPSKRPNELSKRLNEPSKKSKEKPMNKKGRWT